MPDISMCNNKDCKSRKTCYRYMAPPSEFMQSYLVIKGVMDKCKHYWEHLVIPKEK